MRILVVEDTADVGEGIVASFTRVGHAADWVQSGDIADHQLTCASYDLVVLDLMLPGMDGASLLRGMRARGDETPVLVLTARSAIGERVAMLDLGADDYLCKPFDFAELQARARSLLRRHSGGRTNVLAFGNIRLDRAARTVCVQDQMVVMTRRELSLLELLLTHPSQVRSKNQIIDRLFSFETEPSENAVEVLVGRLRRKLEGSDVHIGTLRGLGYQLRLV